MKNEILLELRLDSRTARYRIFEDTPSQSDQFNLLLGQAFNLFGVEAELRYNTIMRKYAAVLDVSVQYKRYGRGSQERDTLLDFLKTFNLYGFNINGETLVSPIEFRPIGYDSLKLKSYVYAVAHALTQERRHLTNTRFDRPENRPVGMGSDTDRSGFATKVADLKQSMMGGRFKILSAQAHPTGNTILFVLSNQRSGFKTEYTMDMKIFRSFAISDLVSTLILAIVDRESKPRASASGRMEATTRESAMERARRALADPQTRRYD